MALLLEILDKLISETNSARNHYQIWRTLRGYALQNFLPTMNHYKVRPFFLASNTGHFMLIFVMLGNILDRDPRAAGLHSLKSELRSSGYCFLADKLECDLQSIIPLAKKVIDIRNWAIAHNQLDMLGDKAFRANGGITPDQVLAVVEKIGMALNEVSDAVRFVSKVKFDKSCEDATFSMLTQLRAGQA